MNRQAKTGDACKAEQVDVAKMAVHPQILPQEWDGQKPVPVRA
jgi:hypothetical protein